MRRLLAAAAVLLAAVAVPALPANASTVPSVLARDYCVNGPGPAGYVYSTPTAIYSIDAYGASCSTTTPDFPLVLESISAAFPARGWTPTCSPSGGCVKGARTRHFYPFVLVRDYCSAGNIHGRQYVLPAVAKIGEVDMDDGMCWAVAVKVVPAS